MSVRGALAVYVGTASGGPEKGLRVPHKASALAAVTPWCDGLGAAALTPWGAADQSTGPGRRVHSELALFLGAVWGRVVHARARGPGWASRA